MSIMTNRLIGAVSFYFKIRKYKLLSLSSSGRLKGARSFSFYVPYFIYSSVKKQRLVQARFQDSIGRYPEILVVPPDFHIVQD